MSTLGSSAAAKLAEATADVAAQLTSNAVLTELDIVHKEIVVSNLSRISRLPDSPARTKHIQFLDRVLDELRDLMLENKAEEENLEHRRHTLPE